MKKLHTNENLNLPTEIWEVILKHLMCDPQTVLDASMVCLTWNALLSRLCKKYCKRKVSDRLLKELVEVYLKFSTINNVVEKGVFEKWTKIYWLYHETRLNVSSYEDPSLLKKYEECVVIHSEDPFLFITFFDKIMGVSKIYGFNTTNFPKSQNENLRENDNKLNENLYEKDKNLNEDGKDLNELVDKNLNEKSKNLNESGKTFENLLNFVENPAEITIKEKVLKICVLETGGSLTLLIITENLTRAAILSNIFFTENCQIFPVRPGIKCHPKTSAERNNFLTQDCITGESLLLYKARLIEDPLELQVTLMHWFKPESTPYTWTFSNNLIRTIETSGHIRTYKVKFSEEKLRRCSNSLTENSGTFPVESKELDTFRHDESETENSETFPVESTELNTFRHDESENLETFPVESKELDAFRHDDSETENSETFPVESKLELDTFRHDESETENSETFPVESKELDTFRHDESETENSETFSFHEVKKVFLCAESKLVKDLRYPNPTIFANDFVFSSTLVSRELLEYWHMDRDRNYWMIANFNSATEENLDKSSEISRTKLHNVTFFEESNQVVTTIHTSRGILFCGTKEGHVFAYHLQNDLDNTKENCFENLRGNPWLNIPGVSTNRISRLGSLFTYNGLILAVGDNVGQCFLVFIPRSV